MNNKVILKSYALRISKFKLEGFTCAFIVAFFDLARRIYVQKNSVTFAQ